MEELLVLTQIDLVYLLSTQFFLSGWVLIRICFIHLFVYLLIFLSQKKYRDTTKLFLFHLF